MTEEFAAQILRAALTEGRAAELLLTLFEGGSCTVDPAGSLVLASNDVLADLMRDPEDRRLRPVGEVQPPAAVEAPVAPNFDFNPDREVERELRQPGLAPCTRVCSGALMPGSTLTRAVIVRPAVSRSAQRVACLRWTPLSIGRSGLSAKNSKRVSTGSKTRRLR